MTEEDEVQDDHVQRSYGKSSAKPRVSARYELDDEYEEADAPPASRRGERGSYDPHGGVARSGAAQRSRRGQA